MVLHSSTNSPDALELKCIEVWLISCTIFVFLALMEYFVVLFGIRYDKSWSRRRADLRRAASAAQLAPPPLHINHSQVSPNTLGCRIIPPQYEPLDYLLHTNSQKYLKNTTLRSSDLPPQRLSTPVTGTPQGGMFSPTLSVEEDGFKQQMEHQTIQRVITTTPELAPNIEYLP